MTLWKMPEETDQQLAGIQGGKNLNTKGHSQFYYTQNLNQKAYGKEESF